MDRPNHATRELGASKDEVTRDSPFSRRGSIRLLTWLSFPFRGLEVGLHGGWWRWAWGTPVVIPKGVFPHAIASPQKAPLFCIKTRSAWPYPNGQPPWTAPRGRSGCLLFADSVQNLLRQDLLLLVRLLSHRTNDLGNRIE